MKEADEIRHLIKSSNKDFKLRWVKAHVGEKYNETVDKLAKSATKRDIIDFRCKPTKIKIKQELTKALIKKWQIYWNNSSKGRAVYNLIPKVNLKRIHGDFHINQVITQHGAFPSYANRFFNRSLTCWCNSSPGTVDHIIYYCTLMNDIRQSTFPKNYNNVSLINLLNSSTSRKGIIDIISRCMQLFQEEAGN